MNFGSSLTEGLVRRLLIPPPLRLAAANTPPAREHAISSTPNPGQKPWQQASKPPSGSPLHQAEHQALHMLTPGQRASKHQAGMERSKRTDHGPHNKAITRLTAPNNHEADQSQCAEGSRLDCKPANTVSPALSHQLACPAWLHMPPHKAHSSKHQMV